MGDKPPPRITFPRKQKMLNAHQMKHESLAQWAARISRLGDESDYSDIRILDMILRDKFVTGLDPGPVQQFFKSQPDIVNMTFKQVLAVAFTYAAHLEKEEKAKANASSIDEAAKQQ